MIRLMLGRYLFDIGRSLAQSDQGELVVDVTDHRLLTSLERPDTDARAWDPDMFVSGQMFLEGYANPVKPVAVRDEDMETMDTADVEMAANGGEAEEIEDHVKLLSSWRYKEYQDQHLITELVRPEEQWKMIIYVLLAIAALTLITLLVAVFGAFA